VARRSPEVADLLDQFVTVRVIQAYGLDLSLFQFDYNLTWAVFFLNADRTVYGRYGTRSELDGQRDVTLDGFRRAAEAALGLHKHYPANKAALAKKTGPAPEWKTPEAIPHAQWKQVKADGTRGNCIHCHMIDTGELQAKRAEGKPITDRDFWPYPKPDVLGLRLDPRERATVEAVEPGTPAERAEFKPGDKLLSLEGQPLVSVADVQWVLHNAPDAGKLAAEVDRGGQKRSLALELPAGWRKGQDIAWRNYLWPVRFQVVGFKSGPAADADRKRAGAPALVVQELPPSFVRNRNDGPQKAGLRKGDRITAADGKPELVRDEGRLLGYVMQAKKPGDELTLTVLRDGKERAVTFAVK